MAVHANTVWEVRQTGADTNGGGFRSDASGVDCSQQDAAQWALTGIASSGSGDVVLSASAHADMVGNVAQVISGTNFNTGFFQVTSVSAGVSITFSTNKASQSICSGVGASGVINIGGALLSPAIAAGQKVANNDVFIKYSATPYSMSTNTDNIANGKINDNTGGDLVNNWSHWTGYDTTRTITNTDANRPTIQATATITYMMTQNTAGIMFRNIICDANGQTSTSCFLFPVGNGNIAERCKAMNFTVRGFTGGSLNYTRLVRCEATGGTTAATGGFSSLSAFLFACEAYANACNGYDSFGTHLRCIADGQTNGKSGFYNTTFGITNYINCTAANNAGDGFEIANWNGGTTFNNCIAWNNGSRGFDDNQASAGVFGVNNAAGSNTSGNVSSNLPNVSVIDLSTNNPFASGTRNFAIDPNSTGGALLKAAGFPATFPTGTTAHYPDIGAAQHQDAGGGGGTGYSRARVVNK